MILFYGENFVEFFNKEVVLLMFFYILVNELLECEEILCKVWGDQGGYIGCMFDVFIFKLCKKLEFDEWVKIVNICGVGYKLVVN